MNPAPRTHLTVGITHVGKVRKNNQDSLKIEEISDRETLLVVADGMGGHAGGAEASRIAVDHVMECVLTAHKAAEPSPDKRAVLREAILGAHAQIRTRGQNDRALQGMGTTCVAVHLDGNEALWAHVGDSRIYLHQPGHLELLTRDHSRVQQLVDHGLISPDEARTHPYRNVITQALGPMDKIQVDVGPEPIALGPDEQLLLCSDGLSGMLTDQEITDVLDRHPDAEDAASALIQGALDSGGDDHITVVLGRLA